MRICLVQTYRLVDAFKNLGHDVLFLDPGQGVVDIAQLLDQHGFEPELLLQQETLGANRSFLKGVENLDCPTVYWAIDTHLNFYWHRHYAKLFWGVLTSQADDPQRFLDAGSAAAQWMPWHAEPLAWKPFAEREVDVGFVGRLSAERQARTWMLDLLAEAGPLEIRSDIPQNQVPDFHASTRIAPNEAILGEINFRLFETAATGCCIVTPSNAPGLDQLFEPSVEAAPYGDSLELLELVAYYRRHPEQAEAMGRAAHQRLMREHTAEHRARQVVGFAASLNRPERREAGADWLLTLAELKRASRVHLGITSLLNWLSQHMENPRALAMTIRLAAENDFPEQALELCRMVAANPVPALETSLAASTAAIRLGEPGLAKYLLAAWRQYNGQDTHGLNNDDMGRIELYREWASECAGANMLMTPGSPFDPAKHVPVTAVDCLWSAWNLDPSDQDIQHRLEAQMATRGGFEYMRLGMLSHLSMQDKRNWRLQCRLGQLNLHVYRPWAGLEELALARDMAASMGHGQRFARYLAGADPSGRILRWLARREEAAA